MRPFWALSCRELNQHGRLLPGLRTAWQDAKEQIGGRDVRGMRFWVFVLGWLACLQYQEHLLHVAEEQQAEAVAKAVATERARWRKATGLERIPN